LTGKRERAKPRDLLDTVHGLGKLQKNKYLFPATFLILPTHLVPKHYFILFFLTEE